MSSHTDLFLYATPAFLLLLLVEWIAYRREPDARGKRGFAPRDTAASLSIYVINQLTKPVQRILVPFSFIVLAGALTPLHMPANRWWTWAIALVVTDFCYYWAHRADHRVRLLWAAHSVHHSSRHFNLSTAVRLPWLIPGGILRTLAWVPAALIGIPVWMIFLCEAIGLLYQFPIHTERVGMLPAPVEYVFNTPSHHRVHHGANNPYLDKNYGGILIIWDRMFGSYAHELEPVRYGLTKNIGTFNPVKANYHEFGVMLGDLRRARSWRARLAYLFAPPGWSETEATVEPAPEVVAAR